MSQTDDVAPATPPRQPLPPPDTAQEVMPVRFFGAGGDMGPGGKNFDFRPVSEYEDVVPVDPTEASSATESAVSEDEDLVPDAVDLEKHVPVDSALPAMPLAPSMPIS